MRAEPGAVLAILATAAASAALTILVLRVTLRLGVLIDSPNARSSHARPKPRGGGLAILGGLAVGAAVTSGWHSFDTQTRSLLLGALVFAAIGLWDDVRGLPVLWRLLVEIAVAAGVVSQTGPVIRLPLPAPADLPLGPLGFLFSIVWLVGVTNFFNFMDGIDGLAVGEAAAVCLGIAVASWSGGASALAVLMLGALLGFLPFNWWPSRIFLGDGGSLPIGFLLAGMALLAPVEDRPRAVLATLIGLSLFFLDPLETLIRRWRRGAPIGQAHREHRYQQLLSPGDPHGRASAALICAGLLLALIGAATYRRPALGWAGVLAAAAAFGLELLAVKRRNARVAGAGSD